MNADITNVTSNENTANADVNLEAPRQTVNATKHENVRARTRAVRTHREVIKAITLTEGQFRQLLGNST